MSSPSSPPLPRHPAIAAWLARFLHRAQPARLHPFDLRHQVDTEGLLYAADLSTGHAHDRFNEGYYATAPSLFRGAIECWRQTLTGLTIEDYVFIDLGCGKGRPLLLASQWPFRSVRGIELHPQLARIARRNARKWRKTIPLERGAPGLDFETWESGCRRISVEIDDVLALDWDRELAAGPVVLFFFNSFAAEVLAPLMEKLSAAARRRSASIDLIYVHPDHDALIAQTPGVERLCHTEIAFSAEDAHADVFAVTSDAVTIYRLRPPRELFEANLSAK